MATSAAASSLALSGSGAWRGRSIDHLSPELDSRHKRAAHRGATFQEFQAIMRIGHDFDSAHPACPTLGVLGCLASPPPRSIRRHSSAGHALASLREHVRRRSPRYLRILGAIPCISHAGTPGLPAILYQTCPFMRDCAQYVGAWKSAGACLQSSLFTGPRAHPGIFPNAPRGSDTRQSCRYNSARARRSTTRLEAAALLLVVEAFGVLVAALDPFGREIAATRRARLRLWDRSPRRTPLRPSPHPLHASSDKAIFQGRVNTFGSSMVAS